MSGGTPSHARRGFALIIVLWCTIGAVALTMATASLAHMDLRSVSARANYLSGMWQAKGCIAMVRAWADGVMADHIRYGDGGERAWQALGKLWTESSIARGLVCEVSLQPAGTRVDVNSLDSAALSRVARALGSRDGGHAYSEAALLDWRDADDSPREAGAERGWYLQMRRTRPSNAPFRDAAEIRLVRGWEQSNTALGTSAERISLSYASPAALMGVPGMTDEAVSVILTLRGEDHLPVMLESVSARLTGPPADTLRRHLPEATRATTSVLEAWIITVRPSINGTRVPFSLEAKSVRDGVGVAMSSLRIVWE